MAKDKNKRAKDAAEMKQAAEDAKNEVNSVEAREKVNSRMRGIKSVLDSLGFKAELVSAEEVEKIRAKDDAARDTTNTVQTRTYGRGGRSDR